MRQVFKYGREGIQWRFLYTRWRWLFHCNTWFIEYVINDSYISDIFTRSSNLWIVHSLYIAVTRSYIWYVTAIHDGFTLYDIWYVSNAAYSILCMSLWRFIMEDIPQIKNVYKSMLLIQNKKFSHYFRFYHESTNCTCICSQVTAMITVDSTTICELVDIIPTLRQSDCQIPNSVSAYAV